MGNICSLRLDEIVIRSIVNKARLVMKLAGFFVVCFCSLFLLFDGLYLPCTKHKRYRDANEDGTNQKKHLGSHLKQCARPPFVQRKTKQLCSLLLKLVELPNQLVLITTYVA